MPQNCSAQLVDGGKRIMLRGYSAEMLEFYHSLPDARFDRLYSAWLCTFTPAAAWRIASREEIACSAELLEAGMEF